MLKFRYEVVSIPLTHTEGYKNSLLNRAGVQKWFELQHKGMDLLNFLNSSNIKIIYPDIAVKTQFAIDPENKYYISNTSYLIGNADRFLVGILNSLVVNFFYSGITSQIRGGYFRFFTQYVEQIPIANAPDDLRQQIASLAQECLDAAKDNPVKLPALEAELNQLVNQAYGLDADDIRVIEGHLKG